MGTASISVVVPCRDGARTIERCLASLLDQEDPSLEVVLVDDGSRDASVALARGLAARHPRGDRLRILCRPEAGGAQRARMDGVQAARGDIVAFTDVDCEAPPGWLRRVAMSLGADRVAIGGQYRIPEGLPLVSRFETWSLLDTWYAHMPSETDHMATGCGAVWRRHLTPEAMAAGLSCSDITSGDDTLMSLALLRYGSLRYDPDLYVFHHTRSTLGGYLSQQVRRGESRSRISMAHWDDKVRKARDTRMGLIVAQMVSAYGALLAAPLLAALVAPGSAPLSLLPFVLLQLPLVSRVLRARETVPMLVMTLPLAFLRNLAWGLGGLRGLVQSARGRRMLKGAPA